MPPARPSASRIAPAALLMTVPARTSSAFADFWHRLARELLDPYRPELHYMRGPGPKWCEKHGHRGTR